MTTTYYQERVGDYVRVKSGNHFYVLDPRPEDITVNDIAHSLANLCRFTGHGDRFYCVGEHSILCARAARKLGYSTLQQLYCLLHDASEAVMNDLARPVKQNIPQYKEIEDNVMAVMWKVVGLPKPTEEDYKIVKLMDNTLLVNEMEQLMSRDDIPDVDYEMMFIDLSVGYNAGEAKLPFLEIYLSLMEEYVKGLYNAKKSTFKGDVELKTYTTAELLSKIQIGQEAEMVTPVTDIVVRQTEYGLIVVKDGLSNKHKSQALPLTKTALEATWKIMYPRITFVEATKHLREGRAVLCKMLHDDIVKTVRFESLDDVIHIREADEGKWYLEV